MPRLANGEWLWGFAMHLVVTNNTMAELWGIREALVRAWTNGYYRVCLQTDSLLAYKWLKTNEDYPMEFSNLVLACRWLLSGDWEVHIEHIWREANSCADLLAKRVLLNRKGNCCMIHASPFCCNVYIGTPWVLSHLGVFPVNKDPVVLCLVQLVLSSCWCVFFFFFFFLRILSIFSIHTREEGRRFF